MRDLYLLLIVSTSGPESQPKGHIPVPAYTGLNGSSICGGYGLPVLPTSEPALLPSSPPAEVAGEIGVRYSRLPGTLP